MTAAWSWADVDWSNTDRLRASAGLGGNRRPQGTLSRFVGTAAHAHRDHAMLAPDHPAIRGSRSLFPKSVVRADQSPRVLVSGINSAKIGKRVMKGAWRGFPIFTVTLEERATCPATCPLWLECYGNAMPYARRHEPGPELIATLDAELRQKARYHPRGFAVRLHVLGDFYSLEYLQQWLTWIDEIPALHVWGYTAHDMQSLMGLGIDAGNDLWPDRWVFRFSVPEGHAETGYTATTIWRKPEAPVVPEGQVCPAQTGRTTACATCGLCWSPAAADKRIVFIGHGMAKRGTAA